MSSLNFILDSFMPSMFLEHKYNHFQENNRQWKLDTLIWCNLIIATGIKTLEYFSKYGRQLFENGIPAPTKCTELEQSLLKCKFGIDKIYKNNVNVWKYMSLAGNLCKLNNSQLITARELMQYNDLRKKDLERIFDFILENNLKICDSDTPMDIIYTDDQYKIFLIHKTSVVKLKQIGVKTNCCMQVGGHGEIAMLETFKDGADMWAIYNQNNQMIASMRVFNIHNNGICIEGFNVSKEFKQSDEKNIIKSLVGYSNQCEHNIYLGVDLHGYYFASAVANATKSKNRNDMQIAYPIISDITPYGEGHNVYLLNNKANYSHTLPLWLCTENGNKLIKWEVNIQEFLPLTYNEDQNKQTFIYPSHLTILLVNKYVNYTELNMFDLEILKELDKNVGYYLTALFNFGLTLNEIVYLYARNPPYFVSPRHLSYLLYKENMYHIQKLG